MKEPAIKVIEELYGAFARRDVAAIRERLSPVVEVVQTAALPWGGRYVGHEGFAAFLSGLMAHVDSRVHIERVLDTGEQIVVVGATRGVAVKSGRPFDVPVVHVWEVKDGLATRFTPLVDLAGMLEAITPERGTRG